MVKFRTNIVLLLGFYVAFSDAGGQRNGKNKPDKANMTKEEKQALKIEREEKRSKKEERAAKKLEKQIRSQERKAEKERKKAEKDRKKADKEGGETLSKDEQIIARHEKRSKKMAKYQAKDEEYRRCISKNDLLGVNYTGYIRKSTTGLKCAKWIDAIERDGSELDPDAILGGAKHNFCRNPDNDNGGPWCFLEDYDPENGDTSNWEHCDVAHCELEEPEVRSGGDHEAVCFKGDSHDYRGTISVTENGNTCRAWDSKRPHKNTVKERSYITSMGSAHNYCRNYRNVHPELRSDETGERPWCFTTDKNIRWEYCDIHACEDVDEGDEVENTDTEVSNPMPTCGIRRTVKRSRIVNGNQAKPNEFPWQIHMRYGIDHPKSYKRGSGYCGGQILNANWILTAAHCVRDNSGYYEETKDFWIAVGWHKDAGTDIDIEPEDRILGTGFHQAKQVIAHPEYDSDEIFTDIALIELATPINFPDMSDEFAETNVRPVCLPVASTEDKIKEIHATPGNKEKCIISGWGDTEGDQDVDDRYLVYGLVPLISNKMCDTLLGKGNLNPDGTNICAHHEGDNVDTCGGDSGGPLVCQHDPDGEDERFTLMGLTSWGFECGQQYPGVYTRIVPFLNWIEETTGATDLQYAQ